LAVLGLSPGATVRQVKTRYRKLVKHCHPDTCSDPGAVERFRQLTQAYDWLMSDFKSKE
jgi:curved DNA-binding protein CbpA